MNKEIEKYLNKRKTNLYIHEAKIAKQKKILEYSINAIEINKNITDIIVS